MPDTRAQIQNRIAMWRHDILDDGRDLSIEASVETLLNAFEADVRADERGNQTDLLAEVERRIEAEYESAKADAHTDRLDHGGAYVLARARERDQWSDALLIVREVRAADAEGSGR